MEGLYNKSISELKTLAPSLSGWQYDAVIGYILLRNGVDYKNTNNRYTRARPYFQRALETIGKAKKLCVDRARLYFWNGVAHNERVMKNHDDHIKRNNEAIQFYKLGIKELVGHHDMSTDRIRACLFNSMGVALHHKTKTYIPAVAQQYYTKSLKITEKYPDNSAFKKISKRVMINSGRIWLHKKHGGNDDVYDGGNVTEC